MASFQICECALNADFIKANYRQDERANNISFVCKICSQPIPSPKYQKILDLMQNQKPEEKKKKRTRSKSGSRRKSTTQAKKEEMS